jgi:hypothetical protein
MSVTFWPSMKRARCFSTIQQPRSPPVVTAKPTVPSLASISTTSVPRTLRPKLRRLCRNSGYLDIGVAM